MPVYVYEDDEIKAHEAKRMVLRATAGMISRAEEARDWTNRYLAGDAGARILWTQVNCRVNGWKFTVACRKMHVNRVTAYRRLDKALQRVAADLNKDGIALAPADLASVQHLIQISPHKTIY